VRKVVAILLVVLLLFNVLGFYGLLVSLRLKTTEDLVQRLDCDDYTESETITLKMPTSLPYTSDEEDYKRVDGEIEFNGEFFRLVKQKLSKDTVYIVCIRDTESGRIERSLNDYVKTFSDKSPDTKTTSKIFQTIIKDYLPTHLTLVQQDFGWNKKLTTSIHCYPSLSLRHTQRLVQPPELRA